MEPVDTEHSATTDNAGRFQFRVAARFKHPLLVMDPIAKTWRALIRAERKRGPAAGNSIESARASARNIRRCRHRQKAILGNRRRVVAGRSRTAHWTSRDLQSAARMKAGLKCRYRPENMKWKYTATAMEPILRTFAFNRTPILELTADKLDFDLGALRLGPYLLPRIAWNWPRSAERQFRISKTLRRTTASMAHYRSSWR